MADNIFLIAAGIVISTIAMAVGIGGGILWTPLFILAYNISPQEAVATSIVIQVFGMGSGALAYWRSKLSNPSLIIVLYLAALPGIIVGSIIAVKLSQWLVQIALGTMALTLSLLFVASDDGISDTSEFQPVIAITPQVWRILPIPGFFGLVMGVLSVGIGEWLIPALKTHLHLSMRQAIGTVVPTMFLLASSAALIHWSLSQEVRWELTTLASVGTIIGGQIGPYISRYINDRLLKEIFIYLMTLVGIHLIFQAI